MSVKKTANVTNKQQDTQKMIHQDVVTEWREQNKKQIRIYLFLINKN